MKLIPQVETRFIYPITGSQAANAVFDSLSAEVKQAIDEETKEVGKDPIMWLVLNEEANKPKFKLIISWREDSSDIKEEPRKMSDLMAR